VIDHIELQLGERKISGELTPLTGLIALGRARPVTKPSSVPKENIDSGVMLPLITERPEAMNCITAQMASHITCITLVKLMLAVFRYP